MTLSFGGSATLPPVDSLTLLHRSKDRPGAISENVGPVWATCLREIAFVAEETSQEAGRAVKDVEIHRDEQAFLFLMEILCGLKSPVLGETEVMGQFKTFVNTLAPDHPLKRSPALLPFIFNSVKEARTRYLSATGSLTYGQIVRRWLKDSSSVALWGYGSLGTEIYPWIREKTRAVVVRTERRDEGVPFVTSPTGFSVDTHVIAAPLSDEVVARLAEDALVVDLRDRALPSRTGLHNLADLFREIRDLRRERDEIVPRCQSFLQGKAIEYFERHQIRPFGWEDLCG